MRSKRCSQPGNALALASTWRPSLGAAKAGARCAERTSHAGTLSFHKNRRRANGKHDDQVDSTAQFLDWFKKPFPGQGIFEYYREMAEKLKPPEPVYVRLKAPPGIGAVQTRSGQRTTIGEDRIVEMSAEDANCLIPYGWTRLPEQSADDVG